MPLFDHVQLQRDSQEIHALHALHRAVCEIVSCAHRGVFATRQLAKRQLTWLRSMPLRHVIQADASDVLPQALQWVDAQLS